MMQKAGLNGVRIGEFAWSKLEPTPGAYDFSWMDRAVELLARYRIKVMMRTLPPWVFHDHRLPQHHSDSCRWSGVGRELVK